MKIAIDIDGVVIDFVEAFIRTLREEEEIELRYEDIFCYDFSQVLGISKRDTLRLIERTIRENKFKLIPGAREGIERLRAASHEVILTTSRPKAFLSETTRVLAQHQIRYDVLLFEEFLKKGERCKGVGLFIEDNIEEAVHLGACGTPVLLYLHPWNRGTRNVRNLFTFVRNWNEIFHHVKELSKETCKEEVIKEKLSE